MSTGRARLIEPGTRRAAFRWGRPGVAALGGFDRERLLDPEDPLLTRDDVAGTPHSDADSGGTDSRFGDVFEGINA